MRPQNIFLLIAAGISIVAAAAPVDHAKTKALMDQFLSHMIKLKPYMVSAAKFEDPENDAIIDDHLKQLAVLAKQANHDPELKKPGYRVSAAVLQNHIAETERVFRSGKKPYARWMLDSTLSVCMSCHTEVPARSRNLTSLESTEVFTSPFDRAEFMFATRAFDEAKGIYDGLIIGYPKDHLTSQQLESALERVITYYARIKRDPEGALRALKRYEENKKIPTYLREDMDAWIDAFRKWREQPAPDPDTASSSAILNFAEENLHPKTTGYVVAVDNPRAATYLKVSGILYEYLQKHPDTPATPDILYWLAICDKGLNNNFFFSLGDIYLRQCIVRYPRSPIAKTCYNEYEDETILSYSGSSGTHVPEDVKQDLARLRTLVIAPPPSTGVGK